MHLTSGITITALIVAGTVTAIAAGPGDSDRPGRYAMQPVDGGFLRLDTETGAVSHCAKQGIEFACQPIRDERSEAKEVDKLRSENAELRAEVKRLTDQIVQAPPTDSPKKFELPSEQDVDKAMDYVERMVKKFRDRLKSLEKDSPPGKGTQL